MNFEGGWHTNRGSLLDVTEMLLSQGTLLFVIWFNVGEFMNWRGYTPEGYPAHIFGCVLSQGTILTGAL